MEWLENIKKLKKEKGLTNESLSEKSGISVGTLNKLLSGATTDPKLSTLRPLADALEVSLDELLAIRKENTGTACRARRKIRRARRLRAGNGRVYHQ